MQYQCKSCVTLEKLVLFLDILNWPLQVPFFLWFQRYLLNTKIIGIEGLSINAATQVLHHKTLQKKGYLITKNKTDICSGKNKKKHYWVQCWWTHRNEQKAHQRCTQQYFFDLRSYMQMLNLNEPMSMHLYIYIYINVMLGKYWSHLSICLQLLGWSLLGVVVLIFLFVFLDCNHCHI